MLQMVAKCIFSGALSIPRRFLQLLLEGVVVPLHLRGDLVLPFALPPSGSSVQPPSCSETSGPEVTTICRLAETKHLQKGGSKTR